MTDVIQSARLDLIPMTPEFLRACLDGDRAAAESILGRPVPDAWMEDRGLMQMRLDQLEADPSVQPWLVRAMVLRETGAMVGGIGFHTAPDPEYLRDLAPGGVELGYRVFEPYRRRGYAREAAQALMDWAAQNHGVRRFVLSISPTNVPSLAMADQFGFHKIGSHIDEEDGPEDIFELNVGT